MKAVQIAAIPETEEYLGKIIVLFDNGKIGSKTIFRGEFDKTWEPLELPDESIFSVTHNKEEGCQRS